MASTEWVTPPKAKYLSRSSFEFKYDPFDYKNTKFYKYLMDDTDHISHKIREIVNETFTFHVDSLENKYAFYGIYRKLFDDNLFEIIYEIIDGTDAIDNFIICELAIDINNYDILDFAIAKGFDVRKKNNFFQSDILMHAVSMGNLEFCQYLVSKGASPFDNDCIALKESCCINQCDILEYFLELGEINNEQLKIFLSGSIESEGFSKNHKKIKKILDKGLDLNSLDQKFFDGIGHYNINLFNFFFENGLEINSNILLGSACVNNNCDLAKICLKNGSRPNNAILEKVFYNFNLPILKLFLQYGIDFSTVTITNEFDELIMEFEKNGMCRTNLLIMMMLQSKKHTE